MGERDLAERAAGRRDADDRAAADEDEREGADELGDEVPPGVFHGSGLVEE